MDTCRGLLAELAEMAEMTLSLLMNKGIQNAHADGRAKLQQDTRIAFFPERTLTSTGLCCSKKARRCPRFRLAGYPGTGERAPKWALSCGYENILVEAKSP